MLFVSAAERIRALRRLVSWRKSREADNVPDCTAEITDRRKAISHRDSRRIVQIITGCCLCLALTGCASASGFFSLREKAPNAYDVATEPPLAMPPNFNKLPKPTPGAPPTQRTNSAQLAEAALDPQAALNSQDPRMTPGQRALLQAAGPPPRNLQAELYRISGPPVIVNAKPEWRRIQEDAALGKPVTDGKTPVIKSRGQGVLGRLAAWF